MHVLSETGWVDSYVPYHRHAGQIRISVRAWFRTYEIDDTFVSYRRSVRKVYEYARAYGLVSTFRKATSRSAEKTRNEKYLAFGWGVAEDMDAERGIKPGDAVCFVAPFHPPCVDQVSLHGALVKLLPQRPADLDSEGFVFTGNLSSDDWAWQKIAGWTDWSGMPLDRSFLDRTFQKLESALFLPDISDGLLKLPVGGTEPPTQKEVVAGRPGRKRAVMFGMGQYAKVMVAPRMGRYMDIACWHEVDPTQLGVSTKHRAELRTSIHPEPDEQYDVYLVAGFHHTHTPIALVGLSQGASVLVEKPVATTSEQVDQLVECLAQSSGKLYVGYHKQYSPLNRYLERDLQITDSTPVSLRCVVYEVPLPNRHWYHWPNSRGRIISNGCHWIDYFLHLNKSCKPTRIESTRRANGDVLVLIDLENDASLTLVITEQGSARLGVRDLIHFTVGRRTAVIADQCHYVAESSERILRKTKVGRNASQNEMYHSIGRRIASDAEGDSSRSIEISARTVVEAEDRLS